jgi:hypothetical protein
MLVLGGTMIRLTELEVKDREITIKIEGYLTEASFKVLDDVLTEYAQRQILQVHLMADGLLSVDRHAAQGRSNGFDHGISLQFYTYRIALQHLLHSCGFQVTLQTP